MRTVKPRFSKYRDPLFVLEVLYALSFEESRPTLLPLRIDGCSAPAEVRAACERLGVCSTYSGSSSRICTWTGTVIRHRYTAEVKAVSRLEAHLMPTCHRCALFSAQSWEASRTAGCRHERDGRCNAWERLGDTCAWRRLGSKPGGALKLPGARPEVVVAQDPASRIVTAWTHRALREAKDAPGLIGATARAWLAEPHEADWASVASLSRGRDFNTRVEHAKRELAHHISRQVDLEMRSRRQTRSHS